MGELLRVLKPFTHLMIRIPLGLIFVAHACQDLFGWWGGEGLVPTIRAFQAYMGIPAPVTVFAIVLQLAGGLCVLVGFLIRPASLTLAVVMLVAIVTVHAPHGFFLNWEMTPGQGHGIEMNLALLGMCFALAIGGAGGYAFDRQDEVELRGDR